MNDFTILHLSDLAFGVRPHEEEINISKEFINKTKGAVVPYAARTNQKTF